MLDLAAGRRLCPRAIATIDNLGRAMPDALIDVDVHTMKFPIDEICGQVVGFD